MAAKQSKGFGQLSTKHIAVDKANTLVIISAAAAAAIIVFTFFAGKALIEKIAYQNEVISQRNKANQQLEQNIESINQLTAAYTAFDSAPESVIGTPDKNSKIVLDALPSVYDYPALASSLDSIVKNAGLKVNSITGTDQEETAEKSSISPTPVPIPFEISASGSYESLQRLVADLERSIRPFKIAEVTISGKDSDLTISIKGETYYQPKTEIGIKEEVVKTNGSSAAEPTSASSSATQTGATQ